MADFVLGIFGETPTAMETNFNNAFSGLLNHTIIDIGFVTGDRVRTKNFELQFITRYNDSGTPITNPYKLKVFTGRTLIESVNAVTAYIAANPGYWFGPVRGGYLSQERQSTTYIVYVVYNENAADGSTNWGAGGGAVIGPAGGDLTGFYPNPDVVGLYGVPIAAPAATAGAQLLYDITTNELVWTPTLVYTSLANAAAAQAADGQIIGQVVIIYGSAGGAEDGTYRINAITGNTADYTKISDATNTAAEVAIVDAGGYYTSSNVEGALQELGAGTVGQTTSGALAVGTTAIATVPLAAAESVLWDVTLTKGTVRYSATIRASHDGVLPYHLETDVVLTPGTVDCTLDVDISGADLRLTATAASLGWVARIRSISTLRT
jgi:hypothetical protein